MTLQTKKSINLTGESTIDRQQVIYLSANVTTDSAGDTYINQSVSNQMLYRQHRTECRKDIDDFQDKVWAVEDELLKETEKVEEEPEKVEEEPEKELGSEEE